MKTTILAASAALMLSTAAQAGDWSTRWTGPNGETYEGNGNCANGTCQSAGTFTGPLAESGIMQVPRTKSPQDNGLGRQACRSERRNVATLVDMASAGRLIDLDIGLPV